MPKPSLAIDDRAARKHAAFQRVTGLSPARHQCVMCAVFDFTCKLANKTARAVSVFYVAF